MITWVSDSQVDEITWDPYLRNNFIPFTPEPFSDEYLEIGIGFTTAWYSGFQST